MICRLPRRLVVATFMHPVSVDAGPGQLLDESSHTLTPALERQSGGRIASAEPLGRRMFGSSAVHRRAATVDSAQRHQAPQKAGIIGGHKGLLMCRRQFLEWCPPRIPEALVLG